MLGIGILRRFRHSLGLLTGKSVGFLPDNIPGYCIDLVGIRTLVRVELKDIAGLARIAAEHLLGEHNLLRGFIQPRII